MSEDRPSRPDHHDRPPAARAGVFIAGLTGGVGGLLAEGLTARRTPVSGTVRRPGQREQWRARGVDARIADLASIESRELAELLVDTRSAAVVFTAGSNGGARDVTQAVDLDGLVAVVEAAVAAGTRRFILVSVFPEAWRERNLSEDEEFYFAAKKQADVHLSGSPLDWLILRPSLLTDEPGGGKVALGPAQKHEAISRHDVAATLIELLATPRIRHRILELTAGETPIAEAVRRLP